MSWILPGLGHYLIGQKRRGLYLALGIWILILLGFFIAGTSAIDRNRDSIIFIAQVGIGPFAFVFDFIGTLIRNNDNESFKVGMVAIGHLHAIGSLSVGLAGLLNTVAIFDVLNAKENYDLNKKGKK